MPSPMRCAVLLATSLTLAGCQSEAATKEPAAAEPEGDAAAAHAGAEAPAAGTNAAATEASPVGDWVLDTSATLDGFDRYVESQLQVFPEAQRAAMRQQIAPQREMLATMRVTLAVDADGRFVVDSDAQQAVVREVRGRWELVGDEFRMIGPPAEGAAEEQLDAEFRGERITIRFGPPGQKVGMVFRRV